MKYFFMILICLMADFRLSAQDLKKGLEDYWSFNKDLNGDLGNSLEESADIEIATDTIFQKAARFSSAGSFLRYQKGINFFNYFSLAFWMRPSKSKETQTILAQTNKNRKFLLTLKGDELTFFMQDEFGKKNRLSAKQSFTDNRWYFICFIMEGTECSLYINNNLSLKSGRITLNIRELQSLDTLYIGSDVNKQHSFRGALDEIALYNRAISAAERELLKTRNFPDFMRVEAPPESIKDPIYNRDVIIQKTIETNDPRVIVEYWDDEKEDDDIITLIFNDEKIVSDYKLTLKKQEKIFTVQPGRRNYLLLIAENMGTMPPNTARVRVICGGQIYNLRLKSDFEKSSAIEFVYKAEK